MDPGARDFASEHAVLLAALTANRTGAVVRLRALEEAWARSLAGLPAEGALVPQVRAAVERGIDPSLAASVADRLSAAEDRQWEIGTWSSGSGEGLASMFEVRTLQLARAWLLAAPAQTDPNARARALELADAVANDPNDVAARLAPEVAALRARLSSP